MPFLSVAKPRGYYIVIIIIIRVIVVRSGLDKWLVRWGNTCGVGLDEEPIRILLGLALAIGCHGSVVEGSNRHAKLGFKAVSITVASLLLLLLLLRRRGRGGDTGGGDAVFGVVADSRGWTGKQGTVCTPATQT